jgi:Protein of unknown function (DUF3108)
MSRTDGVYPENTFFRNLLTTACAVLIVLPAHSYGDQGLTPYTAEYKVKISVLSGKLATEVRRTPEGFVAKSVITPSGLANVFLNGYVEETSWFGISNHGVVPDRYTSVDTLTKDQKEMSFQFDWSHQEVSGTIADAPYVIPLPGPVQDRVSIQYELMYELMNGAPADNYIMLNEEELRPIYVSNIGEKTVKVPFGQFTAVGIQHRNEDSSRVSTLWCVKALGYLPVIIEQHRDGKLRVRAVLTEYQAISDASPSPAAR